MRRIARANEIVDEAERLVLEIVEAAARLAPLLPFEQ